MLEEYKIKSLYPVNSFKKFSFLIFVFGLSFFLFNNLYAFTKNITTSDSAEIRTPKYPETPRINGPSIFGVRPGSPFFYHIPATGKKPITFSAANLPSGIEINSTTGKMQGKIAQKGEYVITLKAKNSLGEYTRKFKIIAGDKISLTPAMGWNSWNCWGDQVTAEDILQSARAMVSSGLINHGWTYINIDDSWQGKRGGTYNGIQGNEKFPDMRALCDSVHKLGLKAGIYSTPWTTSYAVYIGGSSENPQGDWIKPTIPKKGHLNKKMLPWAIGRYSFAYNDAKQWAEWGIDYLKYDWSPNELPETKEMYDALRKSGRDIILSLSNNAPYENIAGLSQYANSWRTTGDIRDTWESMSRIGFSQDKFVSFSGPGHWNDPDMLVVGYVGWGHPRPTRLTPDEQYTHITLWCLLSAPLLIGCDMTKLDDFTLNLLTNDEVLAVDQDPLGKEAISLTANGLTRIYVKPMQDGSKAVGFFNLSQKDTTISVSWSALRTSGPQLVRDLWRQKNLGTFTDDFKIKVAPHSAELVDIRPSNKTN